MIEWLLAFLLAFLIPPWPWGKVLLANMMSPKCRLYMVAILLCFAGVIAFCLNLLSLARDPALGVEIFIPVERRVLLGDLLPGRSHLSL